MLWKCKWSRQRGPISVRSKQEFLEALESRRLLSASLVMQPNFQLLPNTRASNIQGYTPAQISQAYGINQINLGAALGAGQTIAIVDAYSDPSIVSDLHVFDAQFGLSNPNLTIVNENGGSAKGIAENPDWDVEISLDVEWAHAIAPGANILLVEANSDNLNDLLTAVSTARSGRGVSVVSMSWGASEFSIENQFDNYFTTPSGHQGVTFVASAGDSGPSSAEWPSASPNVLSIGGTTLLTQNNSGTYSSESAWSDSGGGASAYESEPSYQAGVQSTGKRDTPDVAYDANPNTGFAIYDSINDDGYIGWQEVGGTSAGSEQWAALIAIADQGRVLRGASSLDGSTATMKTLYGLYSAPGTSGYSTFTSYFNDIVSGGGRGWGPYYSNGVTAGYDMVTGLGTPKAVPIVNALDGLSAALANQLLHAQHVARRLARIAHGRKVANPGAAQHRKKLTPSVLSVQHGGSPPPAVVVQHGGTPPPFVVLPNVDPLHATYVLPLAVAKPITTPDAISPVLPSSGPADITPIAAATDLSGSLTPTHFGVNPFAGIFAGQTPSNLRVDTGDSVSIAADDIRPVAAQAASAQKQTPRAAQVAMNNVDLLSPLSSTALADAMTSFAQECVAAANTAQSIHATRAWTVTGIVLGFDAVLVGYWNARRPGKRRHFQNAPTTA